MSPVAAADPLRVMYVENDPGDVFLAKRALSKFSIATTVHTFPDGEPALGYLWQCLDKKSALPELLLLDINLLTMNGDTFLAHLQQNVTLSTIPVLVLSGSENSHEADKMISLGAKQYLIKPNSIEEHAMVFMAIESYCQSILTKRLTGKRTGFWENPPA